MYIKLFYDSTNNIQSSGPVPYTQGYHPVIPYSDVPYPTQHRISTSAQGFLEECCYQFIAKWLPSKFEELDWHGVESAELPKCLEIIEGYSDILPIKMDRRPLKFTIITVRRLRNIAVHRTQVTAQEMKGLLQRAEQFVLALEDPDCASKLRILSDSPMLKLTRLPKLPPTSMLTPVGAESLSSFIDKLNGEWFWRKFPDCLLRTEEVRDWMLKNITIDE